jgi:hypothetical protein
VFSFGMKEKEKGWNQCCFLPGATIFYKEIENVGNTNIYYFPPVTFFKK